LHCYISIKLVLYSTISMITEFYTENVQMYS
jgi:hypothetical protein